MTLCYIRVARQVRGAHCTRGVYHSKAVGYVLSITQQNGALGFNRYGEPQEEIQTRNDSKYINNLTMQSRRYSKTRQTHEFNIKNEFEIKMTASLTQNEQYSNHTRDEFHLENIFINFFTTAKSVGLSSYSSEAITFHTFKGTCNTRMENIETLPKNTIL